VARMYETLINPASYAFSIWGIIYTGVGVFCAWQLFIIQYSYSLSNTVTALANRLAQTS
jgi:hypothetical protein